MSAARTGGCQCGALRFRAASLLDNPHVCHCRMCQKATGGFFAALVGVPRQDLVWTAGVPATFASSQGIRRGFCRDCGTPMFFARDGGGHVSLSIGAFDDPAAIPLAFEYAVERRMPQLGQLGHLPAHTLDADPEGKALAAATSRQHPDGPAG